MSGSTIKNALLTGFASAHTFVYGVLAYLRPQTRITTATDGFLDLIAADFFGATLTRSQNQSDSSFRANILANIVRERATRNAVIKILKQLTGRAPIIVEPMRPLDTGVYGGPYLGYGLAGAYGSVLLPFQSFVTAFRPASTGIASVAGYGISTGGYGQASQLEYASLSMISGGVLDADLFAAINSVRPAAYQIWARIFN